MTVTYRQALSYRPLHFYTMSDHNSATNGPLGTPIVPTMADYVQDPAEFRCPNGGRRAYANKRTEVGGLVTVITAVKNGASTLPKTFESIRCQTYGKLQYVIIDGGSRDGTLDLIRKHEADIDIWISEPDQGISDAFNKGIALAAGEYVALVNADDWLSPDHVQLAVGELERRDIDFTFGNLMFHGADGESLYTVIGDARYARRIRSGMPAINHPSIVCRRSLYQRVGLYDRTFRIAMDYEWLLRAHVQGARGTYLPDVTSHMGADGISQRRILESLKEVERASVRYGYPPTRARMRYWARAAKLTSRLFIEQNLSPSLAGSLRALINPRYQKT